MKKTFISQVKETLFTILIALVLALIIRAFILQTFYIPTGSMIPTIMPGDRIIALKFWYYIAPLKRGDIVVFKSPEESKILVKRLVGLPGDTILIKDGKVYVNG
ncbi:MAG TPA: signal peptidase I, partial [Candidatus Atribacteria bacterium]|nr:signal peptidase I [Candidatus Atribacteria bacterium]